MQDSHERFANLEFDTPLDAPPKPGAPPKPEVAGVPIRENAVLASQYETAVAEQYGVGISDDRLWYRNGTKMLDCGEQVARDNWEHWLNRLQPRDGIIAACEQAITAEKRRDYSAALHELRLDEQGLLTRGKGKMVLSENAYRQLAHRCHDNAVVGVQRYNLNSWLRGASGEVRLRARFPEARLGVIQAFAAVSPSYAVFDTDSVAKELAQVMPADARGEFKYDGSKAVFDLSFANPFEADDEIAVGRMMNLGCRISTADDGTGAMRIAYYAVRIRCVNCTVIKEQRLIFNKRHIGNSEKFRRAAEEAMSRAGEAMASFQRVWGEANIRKIVDRSDGTPMEAREVFATLVHSNMIGVPGIKKPDLVDRLMTAWEYEPGDSVAAINRAVTRAAHENTWASRWATEDLEEQAGDLLYNRVHSVYGLTDDALRAKYSLD